MKKQNYKILARNWNFGRYELDIVAQKDGCTVFVEVFCCKLFVFPSVFFIYQIADKTALEEYSFYKIF